MKYSEAKKYNNYFSRVFCFVETVLQHRYRHT